MLSTPRTSLGPEERLDLVFHALSDRTRRSLLARLARGPAIVTELARPFEMSLPAVSKHLRVLEAAKLVVRTVDGRVRRCSISAEPLEEAAHCLGGYRTFWEETLSRLERFAGKDPKDTRRGKDK